jgi:hypothetical protein
LPCKWRGSLAFAATSRVVDHLSLRETPRETPEERFSEGHFLEMFRSGHITAILQRLKELNEEE